MTGPTEAKEALYDLAVKAEMLRYCPKHEVYYRGPQGAEAAMPYYDRHLAAVRQFFPTPVAFYTALKHERSLLKNTFCHQCARCVGFV
jgi:hypothetical protein